MNVAQEDRVMGGSVTKTRIAAALGVLSVIVSFIGLSIHGYPDIGATGKDLGHWATTTNQHDFRTGMYIEGIGAMLGLLFAAWLWSVARTAEGSSGWLSTAGFAGAVLSVALGAVSNGIWSAILDAGHRGTSPQTLAGMQDITTHIFRDDLSYTVFYLLIGYVLFRTRALPRWIGVTAMLVGAAYLAMPVFLLVGLLPWVWTVIVGLYLLVRPRVAAAEKPIPAPVSDRSPAGVS